MSFYVAVVVLVGAFALLLIWRCWPTPPGDTNKDKVRIIPLDDAGIEQALRDGDRPNRMTPPVTMGLRQSAEGVGGSMVPPVLTITRPARPSISERLHAIDWFQFERLIAAAFRKQGYQVDRRGGARADDGIDLILERGGARTAVQCKHWAARKVTPKTIRELLGAMTGARIAQGMLITLKGYTQEARAKATEYGIAIWEERELLELLRSVDAEFDPAMTELLDDRLKYCPRCEAAMVLRTARRGSRIGQRFWGCSRYPTCDYILPGHAPEASLAGRVR